MLFLLGQGPKESVEEAMQLVQYLMENPFSNPLLVGLNVDAKMGHSWFECK